ncbi:MAG: hypothetical protein AAF741_08485 [Bacteroidota bacterium]
MDSLFEILGVEDGLSLSTLIFRLATLVAVYYALKFARSRLRVGGYFGDYQERLELWISRILVLFEPLAGLLIIYFLMRWQPGVAFLSLIVLLLVAFPRWRDYAYGILLRFDQGLTIGRQLQSGVGRGIISRRRRLGIQLQTQNGQQFIPYHLLYQEGFTLEGLDEATNFVTLELRANEENEIPDPKNFKSRLAILPFLDERHPPEVSRDMSSDRKLKLRLALLEADNVNDLARLFEEWGLNFKIYQK